MTACRQRVKHETRACGGISMPMVRLRGHDRVCQHSYSIWQREARATIAMGLEHGSVSMNLLGAAGSRQQHAEHQLCPRAQKNVQQRQQPTRPPRAHAKGKARAHATYTHNSEQHQRSPSPFTCCCIPLWREYRQTTPQAPARCAPSESRWDRHLVPPTSDPQQPRPSG